MLSAAQVTHADIAAWSALEARAIEANAYMSPHFVLPALRFLDPGACSEIWLVQHQDARDGTRLIGACAIVLHQWTKLCPFPHVAVYRSEHSFLSAPLLDPEHAAQALERILDHALRARAKGMAFVLPCIEAAGPIATLVRAWAGRHGSGVREIGARSRAVLVPNQAGPEALKLAMGSKAKETARQRRKLATEGSLRWQSIRPRDPAVPIETFLRLEHGGWKAEDGTSLRSNPAHEAFFQDMTTRFAAEGRAWFTELKVDDRVVASTSNLISGDIGFAFKVGWDNDLRKYGVGILNEMDLVQNAPDVCADLRYIDSGAAPGSFIEALWPARRQLSSLVLPLGRAGRMLWRITESVRAINSGMQGLRRAIGGANDPTQCPGHG